MKDENYANLFADKILASSFKEAIQSHFLEDKIVKFATHNNKNYFLFFTDYSVLATGKNSIHILKQEVVYDAIITKYLNRDSDSKMTIEKQ